ncbi:DotG/IcmE/VirB10 family protein [Leisingera sp. XS_AS12]|uniref:DotG/IcmE/VirB10 family protein n=1 Tax=Leisingera sp. XS_AS12 TaxID=3241294 RepID=UPI0035171FB4
MTDNPNELDHIPEVEVMEDPAPVRHKKGLPPSLKLASISVVAMVAIGCGIFYNTQKQVEPSKTPRAASLDSTPGGSVQQDSPEYQQSLQELNDRRAQRAAELGVTSVPTPEGILKPVDEPVQIEDIAVEEEKPEPKPEVKRPVVTERRVLPRPEPAPQVAERRRVPVAVKQQPQPVMAPGAADEQENPYVALMSNQMKTVAKTFATSGMAQGEVSIPNDGSDANGTGSGAAAQPADGGAAGGGAAEMILRPGDVLYAETLTNVSSDMNSPVLAEIVSGDFKGARLTGSFTADKTADRMVVSFTNMTTKDGTVYPVNAFAVDGATAETAVASDVERRYVSRYGPLIAATFISGYAQSRAQTAQTVIGTGDNATVATGSASAKQSMYAGAANAASAISSDILANAPKGPKIILRNGYPIGIIFIDPVEKLVQ